MAAVVATLNLPHEDPRPRTLVGLTGGASATALYDTGAVTSLMSEQTFRRIPVDARPTRCDGAWLNLTGVDGNPLEIKGRYSVAISVMGRKTTHEFYVVRDLSSEVILGADFIHKFGRSYDTIAKNLFFDNRIGWQESAIISSKEVTIPANSERRVCVKANYAPGLAAEGPAEAVSEVT